MELVPWFLAHSFRFARLMMTETLCQLLDGRNRSILPCSHWGSQLESDSVAEEFSLALLTLTLISPDVGSSGIPIDRLHASHKSLCGT
jgi:hypothetical protein